VTLAVDVTKDTRGIRAFESREKSGDDLAGKVKKTDEEGTAYCRRTEAIDGRETQSVLLLRAGFRALRAW
jgi:hypothetical protein